MIQHIVLLSLRSDYPVDELAEVMQGLDNLGAEITGFTGFQHGPNEDFEGKSQGYPYGFVCTFDTSETLQAYAVHPAHQALGARLVALCNDGSDGIMVADLDIDEG